MPKTYFGTRDPFLAMIITYNISIASRGQLQCSARASKRAFDFGSTLYNFNILYSNVVVTFEFASWSRVDSNSTYFSAALFQPSHKLYFQVPTFIDFTNFKKVTNRVGLAQRLNIILKF